ncbi:hypothetical protein JCM18750_24000 [Halostagnicola bangensis]
MNMERRKILLGSGAVFATALAGCSDSTSEENGGDDDDGGDGSGDDGDNGIDDSNGNESDDDSDDEESDEVPGFDKDKIDLGHTDVKVDDIKRDGYHVDVEVTLEDTLSQDELYAVVEELGIVAAEAIDDPETFVESVETIEFTIFNMDGNTVLSFYVDVAWAVAFVQNNMSEEEFKHKALATA